MSHALHHDARDGSRESSTAILRAGLSPLWQKALCFGLAYFVCAEAGQFLTPRHSSFVTFWLPSGLFVAVLLINEARDWVWLVLTALLANFIFDLGHGQNPLIILGFFFANALQAVAGALLVRRFVAHRPTLATLKEFVGFLGVMTLLVTPAAALVGAATVTMAGLCDSFLQAWRIWWGSTAMPALVFSPFILVWSAKPMATRKCLDHPAKMGEFALLGFGLILTAWGCLVVGGGINAPNKWPLLLFLLWAGLRFGSRGTTAVVLLLALLVAGFTTQFLKGLSPAEIVSGDYIFLLQTLLAVASLVAIFPAIVLDERNQSLADLRASDERYQVAVRGSTDALWDWNILTDEVFYSDRFRELLGCSVAEFPGVRASFDSRLHPDDQELVRQALARHLQDRRPYDVEYRLLAKSGEYRWFRARGEAIWNDRNIPIRMAGSITDITGQKHGERALRESEERYRTVVEFSRQCVAVVAEERFVYINPAGARMFGAPSPAEILGRSMLDFVVPAAEKAILERKRQVLERGAIAPPAEFLLQRLNGSTLCVVSQAVPFIFDSRPAVLYLIWDISDRKRLEDREHWRSQILESLAAGNPLPAVLELIVRSIEAEDRESLCSILLVDEQGRQLLGAAAPSLPEFFNQACHGAPIGDGQGSCGMAAFTGKRVISEDLLTDPHWEATRDLARRASLRSCWSEPIFAANGKVLGTIAIYHGDPRSPGPDQIQLLKYAASLAGLAIERRQADVALQRSEFRYRTLFESAQDAIFMMRGDHFLNCNPHTLKLFGCRLEDIVGQSPVRFSPPQQPGGPDSATAAKARIQAALFGAPQRFEWRHCRLDGSEFDAEVSLNRIDLDEQPLMLAVVRDVTERKQAEAHLQTSSEQLRALSSRLQSLREEERAALAREIHDHLGQLLTALSLDLRLLERKAAGVSDPVLRAALHGKITSARILADERRR